MSPRAIALGIGGGVFVVVMLDVFAPIVGRERPTLGECAILGMLAMMAALGCDRGRRRGDRQ